MTWAIGIPVADKRAHLSSNCGVHPSPEEVHDKRCTHALLHG